MLNYTMKCKLGAKDCMVLCGTRALEICPNCKMVSKGVSTTTDEELKVPSMYVAKPRATVTPIRRKP